MLDKYRALRNAENLVVNRKFTQAIREYEKLLEREPEDPSLLNMLGDLRLKAGQEDQAVQLFDRVARIYSRGGFTNKAIAMYRKIHLLKPEDEKVNEVLADLYLRQGFVQEGLHHRLLLLERFEGLLKYEDAVATARKIVEVGGGKTEHRLRLARLLDHQGDKEGAVDCFLELLQELVRREEFETAHDVAFEALGLDEGHLDLLRVFAEASQHCGKREEALRYLRGRIESTGTPYPYRIFEAWLQEVDGEVEDARLLYEELHSGGYEDPLILDGLRRSTHGSEDPSKSAFSIGPEAPSQDSPEDPAEEFDFGLTDVSEAGPDSRASSFDGSDAEESDEKTSGLLPPDSEEGRQPSDQGPEGDYFRLGADEGEDFAPDFPSPGEEESASGAFQFEQPDTTRFPLEHDLPSLSGEPAEAEVPDWEEAPDEPYAMVLPPLEEALQEADFYVKLGFKEEADRYLKALYGAYPEDGRVLKRVRRFFRVLPDLKVSSGKAEVGPTVSADGGFEEEIDFAFNSIFQDGQADAGDEILRYDVVSSEREGRNGPEVHYDLGLAYKEMGLIEDAVQEFLASVELLESPEGDPLKLLCCSMLANCFLQLENLEEALKWALAGMEIPGKKDYEWKAIRYDLSCVYEGRGEIDRALEGFREILIQDVSYRDVKARVERLAQTQNVR